MSEAKKGNIPGNTRKVICVETKVIYGSITKASNEKGISRTVIIYACIGRQKTAGGYHWKYVD